MSPLTSILRKGGFSIYRYPPYGKVVVVLGLVVVGAVVISVLVVKVLVVCVVFVGDSVVGAVVTELRASLLLSFFAWSISQSVVCASIVLLPFSPCITTIVLDSFEFSQFTRA